MNDAELLDEIRRKISRILGHITDDKGLSLGEWQAVKRLFQAEFALTGADHDFDWDLLVKELKESRNE